MFTQDFNLVAPSPTSPTLSPSSGLIQDLTDSFIDIFTVIKNPSVGTIGGTFGLPPTTTDPTVAAQEPSTGPSLTVWLLGAAVVALVIAVLVAAFNK